MKTETKKSREEERNRGLQKTKEKTIHFRETECRGKEKTKANPEGGAILLHKNSS